MSESESPEPSEINYIISRAPDAELAYFEGHRSDDYCNSSALIDQLVILRPKGEWGLPTLGVVLRLKATSQKLYFMVNLFLNLQQLSIIK
jgi:hypothetical protein